MLPLETSTDPAPDPAPTRARGAADGPGVRTRLVLFGAVLVLAAGGAWGAGRALSSLVPAGDPTVVHHDRPLPGPR